MVEAIVSLIEPVIHLLENRRSRRKQRWEMFYAPVYKDITELHEGYMTMLGKALSVVKQLNREMINSRKAKNNRYKRRKEGEHRRQFNEIREQLKKDRLELGVNGAQWKPYHNWRRRRRLRREEAAFMEAVLAYLPILAAADQEHTIITATYTIVSSGPERATSIRELRRNLQMAMKHHQDLYRVICEQHANLQLAVIG